MALHTLADVVGSGAAVALSSTSIRANWVSLGGFKSAGSSNTSPVRYGDSSITTSRGGMVQAGTAVILPYTGATDGYDLSTIYVLVQSGDNCEVVYYTR